MLLYAPQQYIAAWAGKQLGIADWGPCSAIGVLRNHELVAAAVFNRFVWPNIEISFVTTDKRWATRQAVCGIMRYPFLQCGVKRLTSTTEASNQSARTFLCRMGFRLEGEHPDALPTGTALTYGLLRKDAEKWLIEDKVRGKTVSTAAA